MIVIPIPVVSARRMGRSSRPVLICAAIFAAGAFMTSAATAANPLVTGRGGCGFGNFWKSGSPMRGRFFAPAVGVAPQNWPF